MHRPIDRSRNALLGCLALSSLLPVGRAAAVPCPVPGSFSTIREAVAEPSCTVIELAAQSFPEDVSVARSLDLVGPAGGGAVLEGSVQVSGSGVGVSISDLEIASGCPWDALSATGGARLVASGVGVERSSDHPCPSQLFADGFETGDTTSWSTLQPRGLRPPPPSSGVEP